MLRQRNVSTPERVTDFLNRLFANKSYLSDEELMYTPDKLHELLGSDVDIPEMQSGSFSSKKYKKQDLACFMLQACNLLLDFGFPQKNRRQSVVTAEDEKISLQKELADAHRRIIDLQDQVIQLKDEIRNVETGTVTKTVQRDLKSYSAMLTQNCVAALAPTRIQKAVTKAAVEKSTEEDRSKNLIVFGLPEEADGVSVDTSVTSLLEEIDEKPPMTNCVRLGMPAQGRLRPVKVTLESRDSLLVLLKKASELRNSENFKRVFLEPDRTFDERVERKRAVKTLNELRQLHPERKYILRKGVIECI